MSKTQEKLIHFNLTHLDLHNFQYYQKTHEISIIISARYIIRVTYNIQPIYNITRPFFPWPNSVKYAQPPKTQVNITGRNSLTYLKAQATNKCNTTSQNSSKYHREEYSVYLYTCLIIYIGKNTRTNLPNIQKQSVYSLNGR